MDNKDNQGSARDRRHVAFMLTLPQELIERLLAEARAAGRAAALELIEQEGPRAGGSAPAVRFMRLTEFARHRAISRRTVHALITAGLPAEGVGRLRRIPVVEADTWLASQTHTH
jgi:hypothetical protein